MRYLIAVFILIMSLLNIFSAGAAHTADMTQNQTVLQTTPTLILTAPPGTSAPARTGPPLSLTLVLLGMCCAFALVIGVIVLGFIVRNTKGKEQNTV